MSSQLKTAVVIDDSAILNGQTIDDVDFLTPFGGVETQLRSGQLAVSSGDTHLKHLEDALVAASGKTKLTKQNAGANESLEVDLDAGGVTSGYVPTANGAGNWSWASPGGGGASPIDVNGTAGEALAERDYVYLDESSHTWFKVDIDASGSIKCGRMRGIVNESGGISSSASGSIRLLGEISGFTGLTAWEPVYAHTTAGAVTQTRPSPTSGGAQVAIIELGLAVSATNIVLLPPKAVQYMKRDTLANDGTMTVEHHADSQGHTRTAKAYIGSSEAGSSIADYGSANQDSDVELQGPSGAGSTTTPDSTGTESRALGDAVGDEYRLAQSFTITDGQLSQITANFGASVGSPSGLVTWSIHDDASGKPGTTLQSGTFTPTASTNNVIAVTDGIFLQAATTYWLKFECDAQASNNRWQINSNPAGAYGGGQMKQDINLSDTWSVVGSTYDLRCSITTSAVTSNDKLAQGFQLGAGSDVEIVKLYLRRVGSPAGNLTVKIQTDSAGDPSGTPVTNGTSDTVAASSLSTSYALVEFTFATNPTLSGSTQYHIVLETTASQSDTDYVEWGADASAPSYANGEMKRERSATWSAESADAVFEVIAPGTTFQEPVVVGRWSGGTRDIAYRYDDGAAADGNIKSTGKNVTGVSADVTLVVEVP